jgi:molybdopterin synthase catalytic subunit
VRPPADGDTWVGVTHDPLPVDEAANWVVRADCGAVVLFSGTARNHSGSRKGIWRLEYEAYEEQVVPRLAALADATRSRFPSVGRLVFIHRLGEVAIGESSVVVAASAPHRAEAFEAAQFGIDTLKETIPIWKREAWDGGESWGLEAQHIREVGS